MILLTVFRKKFAVIENMKRQAFVNYLCFASSYYTVNGLARYSHYRADLTTTTGKNRDRHCFGERSGTRLRSSQVTRRRGHYRLFSCNFVHSSANDERNICIFGDDQKNFQMIADELSETLNIPIVDKESFVWGQEDGSYSHAICILPYNDGSGFMDQDDLYALAIQPLPQESLSKKSKGKKKKTVPKIKPYWIDLCPPEPELRTGQPDLLLQAVAPQRFEGGAVVYDLTAGWGQDSLHIALGGASRVLMVERDPIVACLLKDALRRVQRIAQSNKKGLWQQRALKLAQIFRFQQGDARELLKSAGSNGELAASPDIVYLDPMFPPRTKSAAVKKGMQILHGLFNGNHSDVNANAQRAQQEEKELLKMALEISHSRVVVKRPINAPLLASDVLHLKPTNTVKGSINRWDVYTNL